MTQETDSPTGGVSRRTILRAGVAAGPLLAVSVGTAAAYDFPSTNDDNRDGGLPHVNATPGNCEVTIEYVNDTNSLTYFERRIDGEVPDETYGPHPVVDGDVIYPGVNVDGRGEDDPVVVTETYDATEMVEIRLALGGERDWDFDWTPFEVESCGSDDPETRRDCMRGGWADYGFRNQGQCIRFVNTGKDSR